MSSTESFEDVQSPEEKKEETTAEDDKTDDPQASNCSDLIQQEEDGVKQSCEQTSQDSVDDEEQKASVEDAENFRAMENRKVCHEAGNDATADADTATDCRSDVVENVETKEEDSSEAADAVGAKDAPSAVSQANESLVNASDGEANDVMDVKEEVSAPENTTSNHQVCDLKAIEQDGASHDDGQLQDNVDGDAKPRHTHDEEVVEQGNATHEETQESEEKSLGQQPQRPAQKAKRRHIRFKNSKNEALVDQDDDESPETRGLIDALAVFCEAGKEAPKEVPLSHHSEGCLCWHCKQYRQGMQHRICKLDDSFWIQDETCCGALDKCQLKEYKVSSIQHCCLQCQRACHPECLDQIEGLSEYSLPKFSLCKNCQVQPPGTTDGRVVVKWWQRRLERWQDETLKLISPEEFDFRLKEILKMPVHKYFEPVNPIDAFEYKINAKLSHLGQFGAWFVEHGKEKVEAAGKRGCWVVTVPYGAMEDIEWSFSPNYTHIFPPGQDWPASIGMCWTTEMDFSENRYLLDFCDPSYQTVICIVIVVRSSKNEMIMKSRIVSDLSQIPRDRNPAYPKWRNFHLSLIANRTVKMQYTNLRAISQQCSFYFPICAYCNVQIDEGESDKTLPRCDKCQYERYCSDRCRFSDYREHNRYCRYQKEAREDAKIFCNRWRQAKLPIEYGADSGCNACGKDDEGVRICECKGLKYCSEECFNNEWRGHTYWCTLVESELHNELGYYYQDEQEWEEEEEEEEEYEEPVKADPVEANSIQRVPVMTEDAKKEDWRTVCWKCEEVIAKKDAIPMEGDEDKLVMFCSEQCKMELYLEKEKYRSVPNIKAACERHRLVLNEHKEKMAREWIETKTAMEELVAKSRTVCWACEKVIARANATPLVKGNDTVVYCDQRCWLRHASQEEVSENFEATIPATVKRHLIILDEHEQEIAKQAEEKKSNGKANGKKKKGKGKRK